MKVGTVIFTWKLENFSKIQGYLYSDIFSLGHYKWKLEACPNPNGKNVDQYLRMYLVVADRESLPSGWSRKAKFSFTIINQIDNNFSITGSRDEHEFSAAKGSAWGLPKFISLEELNDPKKGYLVDDTCIIEAHVTVFGDASLLESHGSTKGESKQNSPEDEDMDVFFRDLQSMISVKKVVSSKEEAKEALAMIEQALNMVPVDVNNPGRISRLTNAFDILSSLDDCSTLTLEQKAKLFSMKEKLVALIERAAKVAQDKALLSQKEFAKTTLDRKLGRCLIGFENAKAEIMEHEKMIAFHQQQICENKRKKENLTLMQTQMFKRSKVVKAELDVLVKNWPEYEAKMKAAEDEEKVVSKGWSKMKQLFSSLKKPFY